MLLKSLREALRILAITGLLIRTLNNGTPDSIRGYLLVVPPALLGSHGPSCRLNPIFLATSFPDLDGIAKWLKYRAYELGGAV